MIVPLQLVPASAPVTDVTVRFPVGVQLSLAAAPASALNPVIVITAGGKSLSHSRSEVPGAVTVGAVLSCIVIVWLQVAIWLLTSVIVKVLVTVIGHAPDVTSW